MSTVEVAPVRTEGGTRRERAGRWRRFAVLTIGALIVLFPLAVLAWPIAVSRSLAALAPWPPAVALLPIACAPWPRAVV